MAELDATIRRQWDIIRALALTNRGLSIQDLSDRFNVSIKTIQRDLQTLTMVFGELSFRRQARGKKLYYYDQHHFSFGLTLNRAELLALYIVQTLMEPLRDAYFWKDVQTAREKIKQILRAETVEYAERVAPFFYRFEPTEHRHSQDARKYVDVILHALEYNAVIEISYRSLKSTRVKTYEVCPYNIVSWRFSAYLLGLCCKDKKIKLWKVDRFYDAKIVPGRFFKRPSFDVDEYLKNVVTPYIPGVAPIQATIRFTGYAAKIVMEERLKSIVDAKQEPNSEAIVVTLNVQSGKSFIRWLLSFGVHAQILDPPELILEYKQELQEIQNLYVDKLKGKTKRGRKPSPKQTNEPCETFIDPAVQKNPTTYLRPAIESQKHNTEQM